MLYDFHRWQNAMTHGKVHATYLIYGTKKLEVQDDGDVEMTSSAAEGYSHEQVPTQTLTLTSEDRLAGEPRVPRTRYARVSRMYVLIDFKRFCLPTKRFYHSRCTACRPIL